MDINVKLLQIFPVQDITSKDGSKSWKKQEFLTETIDNSQYPKRICFTLFGDSRVGIVDQFQPNSLINVSFDVQSRESNGRWFTSVDAWRVTAAQTGVEAPAAAQPAAAQPAANGYAQPQVQTNAAPSVQGNGPSADDLPF